MFRDYNILGIVLNKVARKKADDSYADYYQADAFKKPKKKFFGF
jgi:hypothetical protein